MSIVKSTPLRVHEAVCVLVSLLGIQDEVRGARAVVALRAHIAPCERQPDGRFNLTTLETNDARHRAAQKCAGLFAAPLLADCSFIVLREG